MVETHLPSAVEDSAIDLHGYSTSGDEAVAGAIFSREVPGNSLEVVERCGSQHLYTLAPFTGNLTKIHQIHILITCEHHSSWCANVAMFVSVGCSEF